MEKCERCGGDIAVMPTICWKCFYSFLGVKTPEQREVITEIESNFAEKVKEALRKIPYQTYPKGKIWDTVFDIIDNILKEKEED